MCVCRFESGSSLLKIWTAHLNMTQTVTKDVKNLTLTNTLQYSPDEPQEKCGHT